MVIPNSSGFSIIFPFEVMLILHFFLFFLPFQFALSPGEGIDLPSARVLSVGIGIAWFLSGMWKRKLRIPWDFQTAVFLSVWFWAVFSVFVAEEPSWAWRKLFFLFSFLPLYFVFLEKTDEDDGSGISLSQSLVFGAFFSALIGIFQVAAQFFIPVGTLFVWWTKVLLPFFLGNSFSSVVMEYPSLLVHISGQTVMRASAFFPDPHMHAFFLGIALPFAVFFSVSRNSVFWKWAAVTIFVADLLTFSRGAYLGLTVALIGITIYFLLQKNSYAAKFFLGMCFVITFFLIPHPVSERFWSSFSREDGSVSARLVIYAEAVDTLGKHPLLGVGLGNYPLTVKPSAERREPIYAHNLWLDLAVEIGIIGTLSLFFFYMRTIWIVYMRSRSGTKSFSLAIFCSLLIFFGHSLVETPIFSVQVLPILLFVLAMGNRSYGQK